MKTKAMTGPELISEYEWLVSNGMSPALACDQLDRNFGAMARLLRRYDRPDLAAPLDCQRSLERRLSA
jgi:hypothetical protein